MLLKEKHVLSTASHRIDSVMSESSTAKFLTHADFVKDDKKKVMLPAFVTGVKCLICSLCRLQMISAWRNRRGGVRLAALFYMSPLNAVPNDSSGTHSHD